MKNVEELKKDGKNNFLVLKFNDDSKAIVYDVDKDLVYFRVKEEGGPQFKEGLLKSKDGISYIETKLLGRTVPESFFDLLVITKQVKERVKVFMEDGHVHKMDRDED